MNSEQKPTILIVDDTPDNITLLCSLLGDKYRNKVAINGIKALKIAESESKPDLILLDIMMPDMDGIEALKRIREIEDQHSIALGSGSSILMTTSLSDTGSITQAYKNLCDAYITKPIDQAQLHEALRNLNLIL